MAAAKLLHASGQAGESPDLSSARHAKSLGRRLRAARPRVRRQDGGADLRRRGMRAARRPPALRAWEGPATLSRA